MVRIFVPFNPVSAGQVWTYVTRVLTSLATSPLTLIEHEIKFPSAEALNAITVTDPTDTTTKTITVALPSGASIVRVLLVAIVTALNNTENGQKIDVDVKGNKSGGSFSTFFSQDDCMGFGPIDGATCSLVAVQDVSALVDMAETYGFKCTITQSAAQSVRYTTEYLLIVTYKMS